MSEQRLERAKALIETDVEQALRLCNEILDEDYDSAIAQMALFLVGHIFMESGRWGLAYQTFCRVYQLRPDRPEVAINIGKCLQDYDAERSKAWFEKALSLNGKDAVAIGNLGLAYLLTGEPEKCIELTDKALALDPGLTDAVHNRALARLMLRDWRAGWQDWVTTLGSDHRIGRDYGLPEWDGKAEGTVIIYGEQGVGDEVRLASCIPDVLRTNKVVLDCDARLEKLFRNSFNCTVYGDRFSDVSRAADCKADYQCAIGQLPHFFRNADESFPGTPYLCPEYLELPAAKGNRIGIAWTGGMRHTNSKGRSLQLSDLGPLLDHFEQDTFVVLEYTDPDLSSLREYQTRIEVFPEYTAKGKDIAPLAALINQLDVVVTCSTTVAHLCGAIGKECYVLTPSVPNYLDGLSGSSSVWYNSVTLHRQLKNESWTDCVLRFVRSVTRSAQ